MTKPSTSNQQPATGVPADNPLFLREQVVGVLGESKRLPEHDFVRRLQIMTAYGLSGWRFRKMVSAGLFTPRHFIFK